MPYAFFVVGLCFVLVMAVLAMHQSYRNLVPRDTALFERELRKRNYPTGRKQSEYFFGSDPVPAYQVPFIRMSLSALRAKGELDSVIVFYKNGMACQGQEFDLRKARFEDALKEALCRHQGRRELVTYLQPHAPYDYFDEVFCGKAKQPALTPSF